MNDELKAQLVKRLWELCDGAEPVLVPDRSRPAFGICYDIYVHFGYAGSNFVQGAFYSFPHKGLYAFRRHDWGSERRTLAGFLACWIETEC